MHIDMDKRLGVLTKEWTMKWVWFSVSALSAIVFSSCFANSVKIVYGFEQAKNYNSHINGSFYIHAAAFSDKANADHYQKLLQPRIPHSVKISHKNKLYIVLIGPINTLGELRKTGMILLNGSRKKVSVSTNRIKNTKKVQFTNKKQYNKMRAQPSKDIASENEQPLPFSAEPKSNANWFVAVNSGAGFSMIENKMYVDNGSFFSSPHDKDIYTVKSPTSALVNFSIGRRWECLDKWFSAISLGLFYQHSFLGNVNGTVIQYSLPEFTNYNYSWNLSSDILLVSSKLNLFGNNRFLPYITAGLGGAFNHSNYSETALTGVTPRVSPNFSGTSNQFAYNAGAGLDFRASYHLIFSAGYLYQNIGNLSGQGKKTWSHTSLGLNSYELNEVLAGVTYIIG